MKNTNYKDIKLSRKTNEKLNRANSHKVGFTLIELIVVMAVIAILVLLAMPRFANYTQKARAAQIVNDIRVLENKIDEYLIRHEKFPDSFTPGDTGGGKLYNRTGPITIAPPNLKIVDKAFIPESNLNGKFYTDERANIIYEDTKQVVEGEPPLIVVPEAANNLIPIGEGTEADPYQLWYVEHIDYIRTDTNTMSASYMLMRNLDFKVNEHYLDTLINKPLWTTGEGWTPIGWPETSGAYGAFSGTLDGQGYGLSNLLVDTSAYTEFNTALFAKAVGASVSDFSLLDIHIIGYNYVSGLFGEANGIEINNVNITGLIKHEGYAGALIGSAENFTIDNIEANIEMVDNTESWGSERIGGLIGEASGNSSLKNSKIYGTIITHSDYTSESVGGIIGRFDGATSGAGCTIENATSYIDIEILSDVNKVGGIIGEASYVNFMNTEYHGNITAVNVHSGYNIGGIVGNAENLEILESYVYGKIDVPKVERVGGIVGWTSNVTIDNSHMKGESVSGLFHVGGIVGILRDGTAINTSSTANISGYQQVGGVAGTLASAFNESLLKQSYATGNVEGQETWWNPSVYVGGLVGFAEDNITITESYATGSVRGHERVGGLIGELSAGDTTKVSYSYATGDVHSYEVGDFDGDAWYTGGFVGRIVSYGANDGNRLPAINEVYSSGDVTGVNHVGGFAGIIPLNITVSNVYASGLVLGTQNFGDLIGTHDGISINSSAVSESELSNGTLPSGFTSSKWIVNIDSTPKIWWE